MTDIFLFGFRDGLIWFPFVLGIGLLYSYFKEIDISIDGNVVLSAIVVAFAWRTTESYLLSIIAGMFTGLLCGTLLSVLIVVLRIAPIMAGILFSLVAHSISILVIGEALMLPETQLMGGMRDIPFVLIVCIFVIIIFTLVFFSTRLGICIRKYGDGCRLNTRYAPFTLHWLAYGFSGSLYGLGAAFYAHAEGMAKSGGTFEFLVVALCSFLAIDRIVNLLEFSVARLHQDRTSKLNAAKGWKRKILLFIKSPPAISLVGSILFEILIFLTIAKSPNPIYWKLIFSVILIIILMRPAFHFRKQHALPGSNKQNNVSMLDVKNVSSHYDIGTERRVVFNAAGESFSTGLNMLIGGNGCGKSTFLQVISGHVAKTAGTAFLNDKDIFEISSEKRPLYITHQNAMVTLARNLTVIENLIASLPTSKPVFSIRTDIDIVVYLEQSLNKEYGIDLIKPTGDSFWNKPVTNISGGEAHCVAFYCALLSDAPILLIDEPTTGLDKTNLNKLLELIFALKKDRIIIATTHDTRLAEMADQTYMIKNFKLRNI